MLPLSPLPCLVQRIVAHSTRAYHCRACHSYNAAVTETKSIADQTQQRVAAANALLAACARPTTAAAAKAALEAAEREALREGEAAASLLLPSLLRGTRLGGTALQR